jgi:pyridoxal 5'-phosphate synthase pdxT subunit
VTTRIGVLALQGDVREHRRMLDELDVQSRGVRYPDDLIDIDGLVIPGGESTAMSKLADQTDMWPALWSAKDAGMPMFGTCAGMIMLADRVEDGRPDQRTIGGLDITVRRNAFGRQVDSFEDDLDLPGWNVTGFPGVFIRAPWVERVGSDVEVLGEITAGPRAGTIVAVQSAAMMATAFHPEMTADLRIHAKFLDVVRRSQ